LALRTAYASGPGESHTGRSLAAPAAVVLLAMTLTLSLLPGNVSVSVPSFEPTADSARSSYADLPVSFIPNQGQIDDDEAVFLEQGIFVP
jgi:hypothetical protein